MIRRASSRSCRSGRPSGHDRRLTALSENAPTYEAAGVSLATANAVVERLRAAVESTGATGFGHSRASTRWTSAASSPPRPTASARSCCSSAAPASSAGAGWISPRTASTTCSAAARTPLFFLDYVAAEHIELEQVADARRRRRGGLPPRRLHADRRRDRRAARRLPRERARLRRNLRRHRRRATS